MTIPDDETIQPQGSGMGAPMRVNHILSLLAPIAGVLAVLCLASHFFPWAGVTAGTMSYSRTAHEWRGVFAFLFIAGIPLSWFAILRGTRDAALTMDPTAATYGSVGRALGILAQAVLVIAVARFEWAAGPFNSRFILFTLASLAASLAMIAGFTWLTWARFRGASTGSQGIAAVAFVVGMLAQIAQFGLTVLLMALYWGCSASAAACG